jgi:secreted trypsin-like serine protease
VVEKPKRLKVRARTIIGIVAGAAVVATAGVLATGSANADTSAPAEPISISSSDHSKGLPAAPGTKLLPTKDMPPNSRRATSIPTKFGKQGKAFAPKTSKSSKSANSSTKSPNITGGTPANASDFPSVVGIETFFLADTDGNGEGELYVATCTGTVLSPTRILTAGHCTVDFSYGTTLVIAGRNDINNDTNGFVARVSNTWVNPHMNYPAAFPETDGTNAPAPADDLAVLTLKDTLPADYTPTAIAAQGAADPAGDTSATIVGYGRTQRDLQDEGILRTATVPIKSDADCTATWGSDFNTSKNLCAGTPPTIDTCAGDSGGPIFTGDADSRVEVGITDWGASVCGAAYGVYTALSYYSDTVKAQISLVGPNQLDFTGDGHADLLGRRTSNGELDTITGAGFQSASFSGVAGSRDGDGNWVVNGSNWKGFTKLFRVNDWSGNKTESIFARDSAGKLFNYRSDGYGDLVAGKPLEIGNGWNSFNDIMVTNNWIGNGLPNLIGRKPNGDLVLYNANGKGGWLNPKGTTIGTAWSGFNAILTPGSWLGDGRQSLIGRKPNGQLWLYTSNGHGGWADTHGKEIGSGWNTFPTFLSPGDWSGDNLVDMIGVTSSGQVKLYTSNGKGAWINAKGTVIATGWNVYNAVF